MKYSLVLVFALALVSPKEASAQAVDPCTECCFLCCGGVQANALMRLFQSASKRLGSPTPKSERQIEGIDVVKATPAQRKVPSLKMPF